jgi:hypothetical protein
MGSCSNIGIVTIHPACYVEAEAQSNQRATLSPASHQLTSFTCFYYPNWLLMLTN